MSFNRATVKCPQHLDGWASSPYVKNQLQQVINAFQLSEAIYVSLRSNNNNRSEFKGSFLFEGPSAAKIRGAIIAMENIILKEIINFGEKVRYDYFASVPNNMAILFGTEAK